MSGERPVSNRLRSQVKLLLAMAICAMVITGSFFAIKYYQERVFDRRVVALENEYKQLLDRLLITKSRQLESYTKDYSYWDDLVAYIKRPSKRWAQDNLDSTVASFHLSGIWVYGPDWKLLYDVNNLGSDNSHKPHLMLDASVLRHQVALSQFSHFYAKLDGRVLDVRTAPIQPYSDASRTGPAYGWFVTAQTVDTELLADLSMVTGGKVELLDPGTSRSESSDNETGKIVIYHALHDVADKDLAIIKFTYRDESFRATLASSRTNLSIMLVLALLMVLVFYILFLYLIGIPLGLITYSLIHNDPASLQTLAGGSDEFSQMARLIMDSTQQTQQLRNEVEARLRDENDLWKRSTELERLNRLMVGRELKMIELKQRIKKLEGSRRKQRDDLNLEEES